MVSPPGWLHTGRQRVVVGCCGRDPGQIISWRAPPRHCSPWTGLNRQTGAWSSTRKVIHGTHGHTNNRHGQTTGRAISGLPDACRGYQTTRRDGVGGDCAGMHRVTDRQIGRPTERETDQQLARIAPIARPETANVLMMNDPMLVFTMLCHRREGARAYCE